MDRIDLRILDALQRAGRISNQRLAETVGISTACLLAPGAGIGGERRNRGLRGLAQPPETGAEPVCLCTRHPGPPCAGEHHAFRRGYYHIVAVEKDLLSMEADFSDSRIPDEPTFVSEHTEFLLEKLVAHSVHTSSPGFVGHMTSALPYFMLSLSKIMMALNQNLVKIETSKAFTPMERQTIGMMHRLLFEEDDAFYKKWMHNHNRALGSFCSGGTVANITALWAARNNMLPPDGVFTGIAQEGLGAALQHYQHSGLAVLVSERYRACRFCHCRCPQTVVRANGRGDGYLQRSRRLVRH